MKKTDREEAKILIVEDSNTNIVLLKSILESEGFDQIQVANSGKVAVTMVSKYIPHLILLDIMMPKKMSGFKVLEILKANPKYQHIPIIVVSALSETEDKKKAKALGAYDYITKPVDIDYLVEKLNILFK